MEPLLGGTGHEIVCNECLQKEREGLMRDMGRDQVLEDPGLGGQHHDTGKLRLDLNPPEADEAMAGVLGRSAATGKYEERNWERGIAFMRVYGSVRRHLLAWKKGEDLDPESGLPHLDHALTDTAFLVTYAKRGMVTFDDRPNGPCPKCYGRKARAYPNAVDGGMVLVPCPLCCGPDDGEAEGA